MVEVSPDIKVPTSQSHHINPSNAEATFVQSTRTLNIMKIILNLSYMKDLAAYSRMSTHVPGFQSFFFGFLHRYVMAKLATSSK